MYCRKCLKKGKKVNMIVEIIEQCYICPECKNIVFWDWDKNIRLNESK